MGEIPWKDVERGSQQKDEKDHGRVEGGDDVCFVSVLKAGQDVTVYPARGVVEGRASCVRIVDE